MREQHISLPGIFFYGAMLIPPSQTVWYEALGNLYTYNHEYHDDSHGGCHSEVIVFKGRVNGVDGKCVGRPVWPASGHDVRNIKHLQAAVDNIKEHEVNDGTDGRKLDVSQALPCIGAVYHGSSIISFGTEERPAMNRTM